MHDDRPVSLNGKYYVLSNLFSTSAMVAFTSESELALAFVCAPVGCNPQRFSFPYVSSCQAVFLSLLRSLQCFFFYCLTCSYCVIRFFSGFFFFAFLVCSFFLFPFLLSFFLFFFFYFFISSGSFFCS